MTSSELLWLTSLSFTLLKFARCSACFLLLLGRSFYFRLLSNKNIIFYKALCNEAIKKKKNQEEIHTITINSIMKVLPFFRVLNYLNIAITSQFQSLHPTLRLEEIDPVTVKNVSSRPWVLTCLLFMIFLQPLRIRSSLTTHKRTISSLFHHTAQQASV